MSRKLLPPLAVVALLVAATYLLGSTSGLPSFVRPGAALALLAALLAWVRYGWRQHRTPSSNR